MEETKNNILIIDDQLENIQLAINILNLNHYNLGFATNAKDAMTALQKNPYDLILLDVVMPDIDGFELMAQLKKSEFSDIPVIFLTGKDKMDDLVKGYELGCVDYILKPFRSIELLQRVNLHIKLIKQERALAQKVNGLESDLIRKDEQMIQQNRLAMMGEMLSMITHQWRQPLSTLSTIAIGTKITLDLDIYDLAQEEGRKGFVQYILDSNAQMDYLITELNKTINDFKDYYKLDKELKLQTMDTPVKLALSVMRNSVLSNDIEISTNFKKPIKGVPMLERELMQVIVNIIKNAQDNFKVQGTTNPKISISVEDKNISICDNGGGIPENILGEIFNPYFTTKGEDGGTGLGLYMSKKILEDHHKGSIKVENSDAGACFTISL